MLRNLLLRNLVSKARIKTINLLPRAHLLKKPPGPIVLEDNAVVISSTNQDILSEDEEKKEEREAEA